MRTGTRFHANHVPRQIPKKMLLLARAAAQGGGVPHVDDPDGVKPREGDFSPRIAVILLHLVRETPTLGPPQTYYPIAMYPS